MIKVNNKDPEQRRRLRYLSIRKSNRSSSKNGVKTIVNFSLFSAYDHLQLKFQSLLKANFWTISGRFWLPTFFKVKTDVFNFIAQSFLNF